MRLLSFLLASLLAVGASADSMKRPDEATKKLADGWARHGYRLRDAHDYARAAKKFDRACALACEPKWMFEEADAWDHAGNRPKAVQAFTRFLAIAPTSAPRLAEAKSRLEALGKKAELPVARPSSPAGNSPAAPTGPVACKRADKPTLAVLALHVSGFSPDDAGLFDDALRAELAETGCFRVQDRASMDEILTTQKANGSDACDQSCAVEAGHLLQVALLASGRVQKTADGTFVIATVTDVESGTVYRSIHVKAPTAGDEGVMDSLGGVARQLAE